MKKLVASLATGLIIAGAGITTVSAEEYQVEKGDNLWNIAEEYNTTIDNLVEINGLKTTVIQPKQKLFINETYEVEKGDTLTGIGNLFNVKVNDIKEWNKLESDLILIGQKLEIKDVNINQVEENQPAQSEKSKSTAKAEAKPVKKQEANVTKKQATKTESAKVKTSSKANDNSPEGRTFSVSATAYTAQCTGCSGVTYTGIDLNADRDAKVIAVDPSVIPLGSEVYVEGYGYAIAGDIGSAINGNEIDLHVRTKDEAFAWGRRTVNVTVLN